MNMAANSKDAQGAPKVHPTGQAILRALPGRQRDICVATGLSQATVSRWCETLVARKLIHIHLYQRNTPGGGPARPFYKVGPKPPGQVVARPDYARSAALRQKRYRARLAAEGEEEPWRKRRRAANVRVPKIDALTAAFYGKGARHGSE